MAKSTGKGVGGKKNPNPVFNAVVKKPGGRVGGTNKAAKVNPAPGKKGINSK